MSNWHPLASGGVAIFISFLFWAWIDSYRGRWEEFGKFWAELFKASLMGYIATFLWALILGGLVLAIAGWGTFIYWIGQKIFH